MPLTLSVCTPGKSPPRGTAVLFIASSVCTQRGVMDVVIDQFSNPLGTRKTEVERAGGDEAEGNQLAQIADETEGDAVLSPVVSSFMLGRFAAQVVNPSWVPVALRLPAVLVWGRLGTWINWKQLISLGNISLCCMMLGMLVLTFFLPSLQRVTQAEGHLVKLGAGVVKISERVERSLRLWAGALGILGVVFFVSGVSAGIGGAINTVRLWPNPEWGGLAAFPYVSLVLPTFLAWWWTLKLGSNLVADAVIDARKHIRHAKPGSAAWDREVVPRVIELMRETLPALSQGWGDSITVLFFAFYLFAAAFMCTFVENPVEDAMAAFMALVCSCKSASRQTGSLTSPQPSSVCPVSVYLSASCSHHCTGAPARCRHSTPVGCGRSGSLLRVRHIAHCSK